MQPMPDITALMKIAQSPVGQKLLAMLQERSAGDLGSIAVAAASGNLEEAKQKISTMLSSEDARELLKQLEKNL